jgi:hypothetical protein
MGLWDLKSDNNNLLRIPTPLVDEYQKLVADGSACVGQVAQTASSAVSQTAGLPGAERNHDADQPQRDELATQER